MSNIKTGTVVLSIPQYGQAIVAPDSGAAGFRDCILATIPYANGSYGVTRNAHIPEGDTVQYILDPACTKKGFIIGNINATIESDESYLSGRNYYSCNTANTTRNTDAALDVLDLKMPSLVIDSVYATDFYNYSHCVDIDTLPGDFDIVDKISGVGIHVGKHTLQLRGSSLAYIDLSDMPGKIRSVYTTKEDHSLYGIRIDAKDYTVENKAITGTEAVGVFTKNALIETPDGALTLSDTTAAPLFRIQNAYGACIDGKESIILGAPTNTQIHSADTEPPILFKHRTSLSGATATESALSIDSIKTPSIQAIHQLGYSKGVCDLLEEYDCEESTDTPQETKDIDAAISDAAINKIVDKLLSSDYIGILQKKLADNGFIVSSTEASLDKTYFKTSDHATCGPTTAQQYNIPEYIQLTDPVTGHTHTYYKSTSFISQEADGSILLTDGYGSEIRMSRGNIYISPALDLFLRPGRDLSAMVPRHQSYNSQQTCTINSSSSMYIRAVEDLKVAGATGGAGCVTIHSGSTDINKGLIITSKSSATLVGTDIYIGRNTCSYDTVGSVIAPTRSGTIIIDACSNGTIMERSRAHTIDSVEVIAGSLTGSSNTAVTVSQGAIGLYSPTIVAPARFDMRGINGVESINVVRAGSTSRVVLSTATTSDIYTNGTLLLDGDIACNGSARINGGLSARGISSTASTNGVVQNPDKAFESFDIVKTRPVGTLGLGNASSVESVATSIYQDNHISTNAFSFPESYGVSNTYRVPGMVWQAVNADSIKESELRQYCWKEEYIKTYNQTETACYPGISVWESAVVSCRGYITKPLKSDYITNTKRLQDE